MRILFARHGESEANVQRIISNRDLPHQLTKRGIAQAQALAVKLVAQKVEAIYASPILRAQQTASIVADRLGLSVVTSAALREFDCGAMEGRGDGEAWAAHQAVTDAWDTLMDFDRRIEPDGESFNDMRARFLPFINRLVIEHNNSAGDVLLISHGAVLIHMLPLVLTNVDRAFTQTHSLGNCALITTFPRNGQLVCSEWADVKLQ